MMTRRLQLGESCRQRSRRRLLPSVGLSSFLLLQVLQSQVDAAKVAAAVPADRDSDLVSLDIDLPPDIQRMFEEMCELEGISPSAMLTRWIDARWEAMGYTDEDLEAYDASQLLGDSPEAGSGSCAAGDGRCNKGAAAPATPKMKKPPREEPSSTPRSGKATGAPSSRAAGSGSESRGTPRASESAASQSQSRGRAAGSGGGGRAAGGDGRAAGGVAPSGSKTTGGRAAGADASAGGGGGRPAGVAPGRPAAATAGRGTGNQGFAGGKRGVDNDEEDEEEEEEDGVPDLDAWMARRGEDEEDDEEEEE